MKRIIKFAFYEAHQHTREDATHLPSSLMTLCKARWPQFVSDIGNLKNIDLEEGDPLIEDVIGFFRQHGREPVWSRFPGAPYGHASLYQLEGFRVFEPADIEAAELLRFWPQRPICRLAGGSRPDGKVELRRKDLTSHPIGTMWSQLPGCTETFRQELEAQGFVGLSFRETYILGKKPPVEPIWQLWSDRLLPPMKNRLVDEDGRDFDIPRRRGCYDADFFTPPLFRFERAAVQALPSFDFALTRERLGSSIGQYGAGDGSELLEPYLIVSQRFRKWCLSRKLKFNWFSIALE